MLPASFSKCSKVVIVTPLGSIHQLAQLQMLTRETSVCIRTLKAIVQITLLVLSQNITIFGTPRALFNFIV